MNPNIPEMKAIEDIPTDFVKILHFSPVSGFRQGISPVKIA
jgi:hypothetical protein